jgi:hypothetical protein
MDSWVQLRVAMTWVLTIDPESAISQNSTNAPGFGNLEVAFQGVVEQSL